MRIIGIMGSPRTKGTCNQLLQSALEGAAEKGAETKSYELIKYSIKYCMGCGTCFLKNPELSVGKCPLKDDMAEILNDYIASDGYIFASPVYDVFVTALMKTFLERKIALTYRSPDEVAKIPGARPGVAAGFKKKASMIVTGNCGDELEEVMGDPCFEAFEGHLLFEEVDTLDKLYVGGVENISEETFAGKLRKARDMGARLVDEIENARKTG